MRSAYLKDDRLADVLALIQVLARDKWAKRWHDGLVKSLRRGPQSAKDWIEIGVEHPELFRVLEPEQHHTNSQTVALISRLVQKPIEAEDPADPPLSPPLSPEETGKLMDLAVTLHDRAVQRGDRWKTVTVPLIVAIIAAAGVITTALLNLAKPTAHPQTIILQPAEPAKIAPPDHKQSDPQALVQPQDKKVRQE